MAAVRYTSVVCVLLLCGCGGESGRSAGGTVAIATGSDPGTFIPALVQTTTAAEIVDMVYDRLADIGDSLNIVGDHGFTPRLADRWTWSRDSLSIAFHLNPNAKWHDGQPVRSNDVRFTIATTKDSSLAAPTASVITNIDSVSTSDSATAVFWFHTRSPQQFYDAVFQNPIIPEHVWKNVAPAAWRAAAQAKNPIGSGRYRFVRWIPSVAVELAADTTNYRGAPKIRRLIILCPRPSRAGTLSCLSAVVGVAPHTFRTSTSYSATVSGTTPAGWWRGSPITCAFSNTSRGSSGGSARSGPVMTAATGQRRRSWRT